MKLLYQPRQRVVVGVAQHAVHIHGGPVPEPVEPELWQQEWRVAVTDNATGTALLVSADDDEAGADDFPDEPLLRDDWWGAEREPLLGIVPAVVRTPQGRAVTCLRCRLQWAAVDEADAQRIEAVHAEMHRRRDDYFASRRG